jgi:arsenate reductase
MKKIKILFLCTGNSIRSQMAEGWAKELKSDVIEVWSAGIEKHGLNLMAVRVMAEAGVDIGVHSSKTIDELPMQQFDYVITLCGHANETCPVFPGRVKKIHVGFDDPSNLAKDAQTEEETLDCYRKVREEIKHFVLKFPDCLSTLNK